MRAICGLLQISRSLEMAKQINNHRELDAIEVKTTELVSLIFAYCEDELMRNSKSYPNILTPRDSSLTAAALLIHNSIKVFVTVARMENN